MTAKPFTVASLAARWDCSPDFIYAQIRANRLRATRLGGKLLRIGAQEVERWESGGAGTPTGHTGLGSSTGEPLPRGATPAAPIDSGSTPARKLKEELRLMRSLPPDPV